MRKTDEDKLLLNPYVALSTIQRYFGLSKVDATDIFIKAQEHDEENGYLKIYEDKVRSSAVLEILGLKLEEELIKYQTKKALAGTSAL